MKFLQWNNNCFGSYDVFLICTKKETETIKKQYPNEDIESAYFEDTDERYYFLDSKNNIITPMNLLSFAFGGMYNGYPPYGQEILNFSFNIKNYNFLKYTKYESDSERINEKW